jgi:hypothetical protein
MQLVLQERATKFLLDESFTLARVLPFREADLLDDVVDIGNDALNNNVGV